MASHPAFPIPLFPSHEPRASQAASPSETRSPQSPSRITYEENGRCYLASKPSYLFPCDSIEANRMDLFHKAVNIARGGPGSAGRLHSAPLRQREHLRILDLGTGTGLWAIEMADLYAGRSEVWGVDLSPFQPSLIPANAKFQRLDIESPWHGLGESSWDLIHIRCLNGAVRAWAPVYAVIYRHLIPAGIGHVEHIEVDWRPQWGGSAGGPPATAASAAAFQRLTAWSDTLLRCMDRADRPMRVDPVATVAMLREAGFLDVREKAVRLPLGAWTAGAAVHGSASPPQKHPATAPLRGNEAEIGQWFGMAFDLWLEALTLGPFSRMGGFSAAEIRQQIADVRRDLQDASAQVYFLMYIWTARRP